MTEARPLVVPATHADMDAIIALAHVVWQATYPALIPQAQIDAMLADRYAPQLLRQQVDDPAHVWRSARQGDTIEGYAHAHLEGTGCKLDKLYVHPAQQGRGVGSALYASIAAWAREAKADHLWLQVNRRNTTAIRAYERYGFRIVEARVFDIGNGYVMDDYLMRQAL